MTPADLATVQADHGHETAGSRGQKLAWAVLPEQVMGVFAHAMSYPLPSTRTEYYNLDGRAGWFRSADEVNGSGDDAAYVTSLVAPPVTYRPGRSYQERWARGVFGPTVAAPPYEHQWVTRQADTLTVLAPLYGDGAGRAGFSSIATGRITLHRDGEPLTEVEGVTGQLEVPPGEAGYRLTIDAEREGPATLSTQVGVAWTFRSAHVAGDAPVRLPLSTVAFSPPVDAENSAPVGQTAVIPVTVTAQPDSAAGGNQALTMEVSFDDGATWTPTEVGRAGRAAPPGLARIRFATGRRHRHHRQHGDPDRDPRLPDRPTGRSRRVLREPDVTAGAGRPSSCFREPDVTAGAGHPSSWRASARDAPVTATAGTADRRDSGHRDHREDEMAPERDRTRVVMPGAGDAAEVFEAHRGLLFGVAYRMLGSAAEAEDVVQETWLRWDRVDRSEVVDPKAYLVRVATRIAIDQLRRAATRRETYVGPWLPEPVLTGPDVADEAALAESVSMAILVVLETLSPLERAVFVLHEAFGFSYPEIGATLGRSEVAVRQLGHRAREHVRARRPRFQPDRALRRAATERFLHAALGGDLTSLLDVLAPDVTLVADGGGKVRAPRRPIVGRDKVARFITGGGGGVQAGTRPHLVDVNGEPAVVLTLDSKAYGVFVVEVDGRSGQIVAIRVVGNPEKLRALPPLPEQPALGQPGPGQPVPGQPGPDQPVSGQPDVAATGQT